MHAMASSNKAGAARVIYWFRTDLRVHDSPALQAALDLEPVVLWPIFTFDPHYVYRVPGAANRFQYLIDCQHDLSTTLTSLNSSSRLLVLREAPQTLFPRLFAAWKPTHLVFERDYDGPGGYTQARDEAVTRLAAEAGVQVVTRSGRTLWDCRVIVEKNGGGPTMSITQLIKAGGKIGDVARPVKRPERMVGIGELRLEELEGKRGDAMGTGGIGGDAREGDMNAKFRTALSNGSRPTSSDGELPSLDIYRNSLAGPDRDFSPPTLSQLGYNPSDATTPLRGGETLALARLSRIIARDSGGWAARFRKPQTSPAAIAEPDDNDDMHSDVPATTTLLSPALHFGALGIRELYWRIRDASAHYNKSGGKDASGPPESLLGQLLFRDMYFAAQAAIGGRVFNQCVGNAHCKFVPWHLRNKLPDHVDSANEKGIDYQIDSGLAAHWLLRFKTATTGFPFIDALMRQLLATGWTHHLGRHALACFLTRGGCYISWERGAKIFADLLLDHEPAANSGNWQWLSCTAFFTQYFRMYSPISFPQKWDKRGEFVRRWCPELKGLGDKYIYDPSSAPAAELKKARVSLVDLSGVEDEAVLLKQMREPGPTYPRAMFDFAARRRVCLAGMKKAYAVGMMGDDVRLLDGSWRELFAVGSPDDVGGAESSDDGQGANDNEGERGRKRRRSLAGSRKGGPLDKFVNKKHKT